MARSSDLHLSRPRWTTATACLLLTVMGASAGAQSTPSGEAIIKAMHDRYAATWYRTLTFTQKTTLRTKADTMMTQTWREKMMIPGRLRIDMGTASGTVTYIFADDSTYVIRGDSVQRHAGANYLLIAGFDVYRQPVERTIAALGAEHYPMSPVHEETWNGRHVYVIGAPRGDTLHHQLWIDKDRLLFVRGIAPSASDSTKSSESRFENYVQMPGGGWLSEKVEFYTDGKLRQKEEYTDVKTNVALDPKIFVPTIAR